MLTKGIRLVLALGLVGICTHPTQSSGAIVFEREGTDILSAQNKDQEVQFKPEQVMKVAKQGESSGLDALFNDKGRVWGRISKSQGYEHHFAYYKGTDEQLNEFLKKCADLNIQSSSVELRPERGVTFNSPEPEGWIDYDWSVLYTRGTNAEVKAPFLLRITVKESQKRKSALKLPESLKLEKQMPARSLPLTEGISVYRLADSDLTAVDAAKLKFSELSLEGRPFVESRYIEQLDINTLTLKIKPQMAATFETPGNKGVPVVIVGDGKPLMLAGYFPPGSSYSFPYPTLSMLPDNRRTGNINITLTADSLNATQSQNLDTILGILKRDGKLAE